MHATIAIEEKRWVRDEGPGLSTPAKIRLMICDHLGLVNVCVLSRKRRVGDGNCTQVLVALTTDSY